MTVKKVITHPNFQEQTDIMHHYKNLVQY